MKKLVAVMVILLLIINIPMCINAENAYKNTLRVGITYNSAAEGWIYSESNIDIVESTNMAYITTIPAGTKVKVYTAWGGIGSDYFAPVTGVLQLTSTTPIYYDNAPYHGHFELRNHNEKLTVINVVNTEDYLASLLGKEMSPYWPIEALKAQAVCARNYALTIGNKHSEYGFEICDTVHCQVYGGINSEADTTRRAVEETKGVMVTYNDEVVPLYYFSCDGGYTEDSENVWVSALGYLRGKKDIHEKSEYATYYDWTETYTKKQIEDILYGRNINIGELLDIRIDQVSENEGVTKLTFVGSEGERTVTNDKARTTLSLRSQAYTLTKEAHEAPTQTVTETVTVSVITEYGVANVINPKYMITDNGVEEIEYGTYEVAQEGTVYDSYTFTGHGWGHRVGMSQWGAYSMAKEGYNYKDILNFYFTDIEIEENYVTIPDNPYADIPIENNTETEISTEPVEEETMNPYEQFAKEFEEEMATEYVEEETETIQRNDTGI